jgi:hypothetical protein
MNQLRLQRYSFSLHLVFLLFLFIAAVVSSEKLFERNPMKRRSNSESDVPDSRRSHVSTKGNQPYWAPETILMQRYGIAVPELKANKRDWNTTSLELEEKLRTSGIDFFCESTPRRNNDIFDGVLIERFYCVHGRGNFSLRDWWCVCLILEEDSTEQLLSFAKTIPSDLQLSIHWNTTVYCITNLLAAP